MEGSLIGENNHLYYIDGRLFINSTLGCDSVCSYCYLDDIGLAKGRVLKKAETLDMIEIIDVNVSNGIWDPLNTIVSFGCYSDPWSLKSRQSTIDLIRYLDSLGFRITLSTKQYVQEDDLEILKKLKNGDNFFILISLPIVSEINQFEKGTSSLRLRLKSLENISKAKVNAAIYMKPYIPIISDKGIHDLRACIEAYNIPVILGRRFSESGTGAIAVVSESVVMREEESLAYLNMKKILEKITRVYEHSYEVFDI